MAETNNMFTGQLQPGDDWGSVKRNGQPGVPASGQAVQNFIKSQFNTKPGYFHTISKSKLVNVLLAFTNEDTFVGWNNKHSDAISKGDFEAALADSRILNSTEISKGIPDPYYDIKVVDKTDLDKYISIEGDIELSIELVCNYNHYNADNGDLITEPKTGIVGTLSIEAVQNGDWSNTSGILSKSMDVMIEGGDKNKKVIDLTDLLKADGNYLVRMRLTTNPGVGDITSSWTTFNVIKTNININFNTKWYTPIIVQEGDQIKLSFGFEGDYVNKYLNLKITGAGDVSGRNSLEINDLELSGNRGTRSVLLSREDSKLYNIYQHGIHNIEYWLEIDKDSKYSTPHKTTQIMIASDSSDKRPYLIMNDVQGLDVERPLQNWTEQKIMECAIYAPDPNGEGSLTDYPVTISFSSRDDGQTLFSSLFNMNPNNSYELTQDLSLSLSSDKLALNISYTSEGKDIQGIKPIFYIANKNDYSPTEGAVFVFNPKTRTNDENINDIKKIYNTANGREEIVKPEWKGVSFNNIDGWIDDPDHGRCLRLLDGQSLTIPYQPFKLVNNNNPNTTIEIVYKVSNIANKDIPLISICDKNNTADGKDVIYNGFELRGADGYFLNNKVASRANLDDSDIMFAENDKIHLAICLSCEKERDDNVKAEIPYNSSGSYHSVDLKESKFFARIYINGVLNRVIALDNGVDLDGLKFDKDYTSSKFTPNALKRQIILGNITGQPGADLDIYEIRVYQDENMKPHYSVLKDYVASLSSTTQKDIVIEKNDILKRDSNASTIIRDGVIDYQECVKKYNTLLWRPGDASINEFVRPNGREFGDTEKDSNQNRIGDLIVNVLYTDKDGKKYIDPYKSGTLHNMTSEGQGTTSMLYFKWNQRYRFDEIKGYDVGFISNANKESGDIEDTYRLNDSDPVIGRLDAKINWASSMQSHKMGSTALYNDLQKIVVGGHAMNFLNSEDAFKQLDLKKMVDADENEAFYNPSQAFDRACKFTGNSNGFGSCRVAIRQEPFMFFSQPTESSTPIYYGMMTFGASKGDKPTFGYDKKINKHFVMIEGTDNFRDLISSNVPWDDVHCKQEFELDDGDEVVDGGIKYVQNASGKEEWIEQFEISMGDDTKDAIGEYWNGKNPCLAMFKDMMNFVYLHNPYIEKFTGNYTALKNEPIANLDTLKFYWVTRDDEKDADIPTRGSRSSQKYDLYRFNKSDGDGVNGVGAWVPAGLTSPDWKSGNQTYQELNLLKQFNIDHDTVIKQSDANEYFKSMRAKHFANGYKSGECGYENWDYPNGIEEYVNVQDLLFTTQFMKLVAGTDNWSKNTYFYNPGLYFNADNNYSGGKGSAKYGGLSKFGFFQDDMDTIFEIDNYGMKTKPYYVEEHDKMLKGNELKYYWNSHYNALFSILELAYTAKMKSTMQSIFQAMTQLSGNPTNCFEEYYQNKAQNYFPEMVYNVTAEKLYLDGYYRGMSTLTDSTDAALAPDRYSLFLGQCLGGQYSAEREWQKNRVNYLSSYAHYGVFAAGTSGSGLAFTPTATIELNLTPYTWMYPSAAEGNTVITYTGSFDKAFNVPGRVPAGQEFTMRIASTAGSENQVTLKGLNFYSSLGNLAQVKPLEGSFNISGDRLTSLVISGNTDKPITFDAHRSFGVVDGSKADNMRSIIIKGNTGGKRIFNLDFVNLSQLWRLEDVDLSATSIKEVILKEDSNIKSLKLPSATTSIKLMSQSKLTELEIPTNIVPQTIMVENPNNVVWGRISEILNRCCENNINLTSLHLTGFVWENMSIKMLEYILKIPKSSLTLKGKIYIPDSEQIGFDLKMELLNRFGNIDDDNPKTQPLYISYKKHYLSKDDDVKILGDSNVYINGEHKFTLQYPELGVSGESANDFTSIVWSLNDTTYCSIDQTGMLKYEGEGKAGNDASVDIICDITRLTSDGTGQTKDIHKTRTIKLYPELANIGDYVYSDGTYGSPTDDTGYKTKIGVCFYAETGVTDVSKQKRLAVALDVLTPYGCTYGEQYDRTKDKFNNPDHNWGMGISEDTMITLTGMDSTYSFYITASNVEKYMQNPSAYQNTALSDWGWDGDVSKGQKYTQAMIGIRDYNIKNIKGLGGFDGDVPIKDVAGFENMMKSMNKETQLLYYPAATYCRFYKPNANNLNVELFDAGKWFLPSIGELIQIWYQIYGNSKAKASFADYKESLKNTNDAIIWSSSHYSASIGWGIKIYSSGSDYIGGNLTLNSKTVFTKAGCDEYNHAILPIVSF